MQVDKSHNCSVCNQLDIKELCEIKDLHSKLQKNVNELWQELAPLGTSNDVKFIFQDRGASSFSALRLDYPATMTFCPYHYTIKRHKFDFKGEEKINRSFILADYVQAKISMNLDGLNEVHLSEEEKQKYEIQWKLMLKESCLEQSRLNEFLQDKMINFLNSHCRQIVDRIPDDQDEIIKMIMTYSKEQLEEIVHPLFVMVLSDRSSMLALLAHEIGHIIKDHGAATYSSGADSNEGVSMWKILLPSLSILLPFIEYLWDSGIILDDSNIGITNIAVANIVAIGAVFTFLFIQNWIACKNGSRLYNLFLRSKEWEAERHIPERFTADQCQWAKAHFISDVARILLTRLSFPPILQKLLTPNVMIKSQFAELKNSFHHIPSDERYAYWLDKARQFK